MKKIFSFQFFILVLLLGTLFYSCAKAEQNQNAIPERIGLAKLRIGMSFQEMNNPYFVVMKKAFEEAVSSMGATAYTADAQHDIAKQIKDVEDLIQKGIDILILNPTDMEGIRPAVQTAKDAGVIVIAVDAAAPGAESLVTSKNYDAGFIAGKALAEAIGGSGEVAILDGIPVDGILARVRGFKDAIAEYPELVLVNTQNGKQARDVALTVTENILQAAPDLKGIFSVNDEGSLGALSAINASGRDVKLTSVDGAPEAVKAIAKGGPFVATAAQFPRDMIRLGLAMAIAKLWGTNVVPELLPIDVELVDEQKAKDGFSW